MPAIGGERIFPEEFLLGRRALLRDVSVDEGERLLQGANVIAVWPVAAEEDAAFTEYRPDGVERALVITDVCHQRAIEENGNLGELDKDARVFGQAA